MDVVIAYVNCKDKVWVKNLLSISPLFFKYSHYYDYGTLRYTLRGIDKYMPYVNNVFLVVSNIEQVPDYVDQSKVKIVLHKDFIPEEYLPTFQANTIEMFMYNIPGLSEEFMYFNDDMIPVSPIKYEELFKDGLPCINFVENHIEKHWPSHKIFNSSFFEGLNTAKILKGEEIEYNGIGLHPVHGPVTYLKSMCIKAASTERHKDLLEFYISTFRSPVNLNQYYWCDILYFLNQYVPTNLDVKYVTTDCIDDVTFDDISENTKYVCINDYGSISHTMSEIGDIVQSKLNKILPDKCKYESSE